ncbi:hypothetical protein [Clostridium tertium]|uniref:hypothetical protein n=1 Tax=Clostridium tertium TaxID=1559 RepID=UPI001AE76E58|nr:hypothetical protein [Clostridium tertium]MBP1869025.1 hypothetical protein [Clostridium tertium]
MENFINNNLMDIISSILAFIAIIISIATWRKDSRFNKELAQKTLNQKFFEEIFFTNIITDMPRALSKLEYSNRNNDLTCENLQNIIMDILSKSMFYKYFDEEFYKKIKDILIEVDEKLVYASDNNINNIRFEHYKCEVTKLIHNFYEALKEYYSGI